MAENTKIAWADNTWNPWQGCHKVSAGCANCYMFRDKKRYGQDPSTVIRSKAKTFNSPLKWKDPARVFVCSWSDFFILEADDWRDDAWDIIRKTPHLTYLLLTKRPENIKDRLPNDWPLPNVWLGVTAENQEQADKRIPLLLEIPAAKHFVSIEPMVGSVDLSEWILGFDIEEEIIEGITAGHDPNCDGSCQHCPVPVQTQELVRHQIPRRPELDWVIVGGESGSGARPAHPDWVRSLRDQCKEADTPFMFKQWGEWSWSPYNKNPSQPLRICRGGIVETLEFTEKTLPKRSFDMFGTECVVKRIGTKASGHILDGVEHMEVPQ